MRKQYKKKKEKKAVMIAKIYEEDGISSYIIIVSTHLFSDVKIE